MFSTARDIRRVSNLRGALINSVAIIPWRRDIRVLCEHPVDTRRISRSAALHLSRCKRPPVADREVAHEDALIIRGPALPEPPSPSPPFSYPLPARVAHLNASSSSACWHGAPVLFFSSRAREHLSSSSTFDHALSFSLSNQPLSREYRRDPSHGSAFLRSILFIALN